MSKNLNILFAGTPYFAACHLYALINSNHNVIGVLTQPDSISGRGNFLNFSAVKKIAYKNKLPIFQPISLSNNKEILKIIDNLNPDVIVVVAYGLLLPDKIINLSKLGCINVHGSLLPRWRGAAPIQRAILSGDSKTGISIIKMNKYIDTGPILYQISCDISSHDTSATLHDKLSKIGSKALLNTLKKFIKNNNFTTVHQDECFVTYAKKINKIEAKLDFNLPAVYLERSIRAFHPWPGSYFLLYGKTIKVLLAKVLYHNLQKVEPGSILIADKSGIYISTIKNILVLKVLKPEGKKSMFVCDFLNSRKELFIPGLIIKNN